MTQCYEGRLLDNIYDDPNKPLHFKAVEKRCRIAHCCNGYVFLTLGDIPKLGNPIYASLRDREDA